MNDNTTQKIDIWTTKEGTRLMWDCEGHIYPVTIGHRHWNFKGRMVYHSDDKGQWMTGEAGLPLREPTREEIETLTWPNPTLTTPKPKK